MKTKFGLMWRVAVALVLVLSFSLVMAVPASANVSQPSVSVDPPLAGEVAQYTIGFDINTSLGIGGDITIVFADGTTVPETYADGDVTVQGASVSSGNISRTDTTQVTITLAAAIAAPTTVTVVFTTAADIVNPAAGDKTLDVSTSAEPTAVTSETYTILALPTVTDIEPEEGNVGDTMWVEVTGDNFTGDSDTNASTTTLDFGGGITVVSTKFIDVDEIDCQITITAPGRVQVAATTAAGTGTTTYSFKANDAGTAQVDVWDAYTITDDPFVTGTLAFQETTTTIQGAEDVCGATDTVIVHAATYVENIGIDQSITLLSLSGADSTIIDGGSGSVVDVTASNVTVDGFTIKGDGTTALQRGLSLHNDGFAVKNNKIIDVAHHNIYLVPAENITSGTIDNNTFTGLGSNAEGAGIWVEDNNYNISGVEITDNTISNFKRRAYGGMSAIELRQVSGGAINGITISGNTISDSFSGIRVNGDAGSSTALEITNNTISGHNMCDKSAGVTVGSGNPNFNLSNNTITDNVFGIELMDSDGSYIIKYNDITGNSEWGLFHWGGAGTVTAKYNWWGDISGPSSGISSVYGTTQGSTALGSGDAVCKDVDTWDPWLTTDQATAVSDGIAYHGSTYPLQAGWNTLSVPLALADSADTLNEIKDLGDFIISDPADPNQNYAIGYYYDAATGSWTVLPGTRVLEPCAAVYVKMKADASFPVLYSGQFNLPSLSLSAGWNLIGAAFGIDKTVDSGNTGNTDVGDYGVATADADGNGDPTIAAEDEDTESYKDVATALDSIADSCSVVVSPSMPGQVAAWGTVASDNSTCMVVGEGYWVFMTAPATYAGFEVTPLYKIFLD